MEWKELPDGRVLHEHEDGFKIIKPKNSSVIPLLCPVCNFSMLTIQDLQTFKNNECCEWCTIKWVDLNKKIWKEGWRPSPSQIKQEILRRKIRAKSISF